MNKSFTVTITCQYCGTLHDLPLDASGHFRGPAPCAPERNITLQVEPNSWRQLVDAQASKTVH